MPSPKITTYRGDQRPVIYSWSTPDCRSTRLGEDRLHRSADGSRRAHRPAGVSAVDREESWASRRALFTTESGGRFTDTTSTPTSSSRAWSVRPHRTADGVAPLRTAHRRSRWTTSTTSPAKTSPTIQMDGIDDYVLRPEQQAAVAQAVAAFAAGERRGAVERQAAVRQDADHLRPDAQLDVRRVLIVTNRPAIANSWFDDFTRFIGHQTTFKFVSESPSLAERVPR
jgi:type II restriction enzyme